jgi:hypothetical protein
MVELFFEASLPTTIVPWIFYLIRRKVFTRAALSTGGAKSKFLSVSARDQLL